MSNTFMKFIDSCVGAIARKVQDEFDENKHPRDKGGKFTSKGGEGRGGGSSSRKTSNGRGDDYEEDDDVGEELIQVKRAAKAARRFKSSGIDLASAMEDLDIPTEGVPEKYLESVFEGSLSEDPKLLRKAEDYIERYESGELEGDEESGSEGADEDDDSDEEIKAGKETDKIVEEFEGSGIDMFAAMADLGLDVHRIPEGLLAGAFEEKLFNSPKFRQKAKQYISAYRGVDPDEEEDWFK